MACAVAAALSLPACAPSELLADGIYVIPGPAARSNAEAMGIVGSSLSFCMWWLSRGGHPDLFPHSPQERIKLERQPFRGAQPDDREQRAGAESQRRARHANVGAFEANKGADSKPGACWELQGPAGGACYRRGVRVCIRVECRLGLACW